MSTISLAKQACGTLVESATREWLVTDGRGGFAMGTVAGLATRRYHGLLVVATSPPGGRHLALAALDPVVIIGDRRVELGVHEWRSGVLAPCGSDYLDGFDLIDGVPRWRWSIGSVTLESEIAMTHGSPAVGVRWRLVSSGVHEHVAVELHALCTWRDVHGERFAYGEPHVDVSNDGFMFEGAYSVRGPGFVCAGDWYAGVHHREEAVRGLSAEEDLWHAGCFASTLAVGESISVEAWALQLAAAPPSASTIIDNARGRARQVASMAAATDDVDALLAHAADQFIVTNASGSPTVVAGYPWFGDWSRDTMTSYEGLFLETNRIEEGRALLVAAAKSVSEGMLANTADVGGLEYNTVDAAMWFLHAVQRHITRTGDADLGRELFDAMSEIIDRHITGTRFGIGMDADGLISEGAEGFALTWMDARVDGRVITPRAGKPVEVNALWIEGLEFVATVARSIGADASRFDAVASRARAAFVEYNTTDNSGLFDLLAPNGPDASLRPNQLIATKVPGLLTDDAITDMLRATDSLVTTVGLRSLDPGNTRYLGRHRGSPAERDAAYHEGTIWPWLVGPLVDARLRVGITTTDVVDGLVAHLGDFGLGSVSETLDGDAPHSATGCPFQAWSVAELLRARRKLTTTHSPL